MQVLDVLILEPLGEIGKRKTGAQYGVFDLRTLLKLDEAAEPYVDAMMTASPVGLRLSKECLNMSVDAGSLEAVIAMEDRNQVLCSRSEEFSEGVRAFLEKRKPVYIKR